MSEHVSDEQLSRLLDGELSLAAREAVIAHVRACPGCAQRHDALVDLAALLRVQPAARWSPEATEATVMQLRIGTVSSRRRVRERDWSFAVAGLLALSGAVAAVVLAPLGLDSSLAEVSALAPAALAGSGRLLAVLGVFAVAGLAALPLSRSR